MKLKTILEKIDFELIQGNLDTEVSDIQNDSRKVTEGNLFFCITGAKSDGHEYAKDVVAKGAAVLIVEKPVNVPESVTVCKVESSRYAMAMISAAFYGYPSEQMTVIGITGTKGKTTTTYMIRSMLEAAGHKTGLIGTIESIIGDQVIPSPNTTPESTVLQRRLREMVDAGLDSVVMEVSSQGLMLDRVAGVDFDYGIFTNLSEDHIGPNEHKDFADYLGWKSKLFTMCKTGIFNLDDPYCEQIMEGHTCDVVTFGKNAQADYSAYDLQLFEKDGSLGISYRLKITAAADLMSGIEGEGLGDAGDRGGASGDKVVVGMPGEFSLYNSLSAIAVARRMGVPMKEVLEILKNIRVKGRVELIPISDAFTLLIDYAHNAVSLESILKTLRAYEPGRLISLFGCGGNRSKVRRFEMGEASGHLADLTIITSDNPRDEDPQAIIDDIKTGIAKTDGAYVEIPDRKEAIRYAILHAEKGDVIVLAGKGHEDYQEIKGVKYPMDERNLIRDILEEEDVSKICGYNSGYFS